MFWVFINVTNLVLFLNRMVCKERKKIYLWNHVGFRVIKP